MLMVKQRSRNSNNTMTMSACAYVFMNLEKMEENLQGRILGLQCLTQQVGRVTARDLRGDWGDLWAPGGTPPSETTLCCAAEDL